MIHDPSTESLIEERLSILTEEIYSAVGARDTLSDAQARAHAVARVQRLIARFMTPPVAIDATLAGDDLDGDIAFGRHDAEQIFRERAAG